MIIDAISNGIVLDHISAGRSMELYQILKLHKLKCSVAVLTNVPSRKMGRKDIIKIGELIDLNFDGIGYVDPGITVSIVRDSKLDRKFTVDLPERVENVIKCKNPRCITSTEQEIPQIFTLTDRDERVYRCMYCESRAKGKD